jgi:hypothetical protein
MYPSKNARGQFATLTTSRAGAAQMIEIAIKLFD